PLAGTQVESMDYRAAWDGIPVQRNYLQSMTRQFHRVGSRRTCIQHMQQHGFTGASIRFELQGDPLTVHRHPSIDGARSIANFKPTRRSVNERLACLQNHDAFTLIRIWNRPVPRLNQYCPDLPTV